MLYFFFYATAPTDLYTYGHPLSLHDALPISPPQEIGGQPKPNVLALLRMKLGSGQIVAADHRRHRPAVIDCGQQMIGAARAQVKAVHEVDIGGLPEAGQQRMVTDRKSTRLNSSN